MVDLPVDGAGVWSLRFRPASVRWRTQAERGRDWQRTFIPCRAPSHRSIGDAATVQAAPCDSVQRDPFDRHRFSDSVVAVIDGRIQTTGFNAEQALTRDTVPVNVDAIIFWHVHDAEKAALAITNYREAIDRVAQTSLREMIGSSMLAALLSDR